MNTALLTSDALETILTAIATAKPLHNTEDGRTFSLTHSDFTLKEIKDAHDLGPFADQKITVDDRASLSAYANRFSGQESIIVADFDALTIAAHLDWHPHNQLPNKGEPGSKKHSVTLKLRPSEEFSRWDSFVKAGFHDQETFARFLEENSCDVMMPDPATLIEISRDFEATVGQTYKSSTRLDNGDRKLFFDTDSRATNDVVVPQQITLSMPFYNGEEPAEITAKFRWRPANGAVIFALEWHRVEYHRRARFISIAYTASEETGLPVFVGRAV